MRTLLASLVLLTLFAAAPARADILMIRPGVGLLHTYGPQNADDGPYAWQDNRAAGFEFEIGRVFGHRDLSLGLHVYRHNHMSGFLLARYRHHFGQRDRLHLVASGGLGLGCLNHRDYFEPGEYDTCSGPFQLAAGGGVWVPVVRHLSLTAEVLGIVSGTSKWAVTPTGAVSAVVSF